MTLARLVKEFKPTVLINNAAILEMAPLSQTTETVWNRTLKANLTIPFQLTQAFCELHGEAISRDDSWIDLRVINISSMAAIIGMRNATPYVATKAALEAMTRNQAREFSDCNSLSFFSIAPCLINTPMSKGLLNTKSPMKVAEVDDVWKLVHFCVNHAPHTASGSVFRMAAGMGV